MVLSDLSRLTVRLKNEFNASKTDLMDEKAKNNKFMTRLFIPHFMTLRLDRTSEWHPIPEDCPFTA